ncbi:tRNA-specific adenosine deaminase subunit tad3 [Paramecium bursaria]
MQVFKELMPVGYSKEPQLEKFIILVLDKRQANDYLRKYKSKYPNYFQDQNHLKLMRTVDDKIQMLFCRSNDFDNMKVDFNIDEYLELELPSHPPIHTEQKDIYNSYWNINHPIYLFPSKQNPKAGQLLNYLNQQEQKQNRCLLYDPSIDQIVAESFDESNLCIIRHATMVVMEKLAAYIKQQNIEFAKLQYIATDLILVIQTEPCIMCSMALVHSRIHQVYYNKKRDSDGGFNKNIQVNNIKQLNHRFSVFTIE